MKTLTLIFSLLPLFLFSQEGVSTTNIQEALYVNGSLKVTETKETNSIKFTEFDSNGTMGDIALADSHINATSSSNFTELNRNGSMSEIANENNQTNATSSTKFKKDKSKDEMKESSLKYSFTIINIKDSSNDEVVNNLDLQLSEANSDKKVFMLEGRTEAFKISGISGGTDGRSIILYNINPVDLEILHENDDTKPRNRIITLDGDVSTTDKGIIELVYNGDKKRWIMVSFSK